MNIRKRGENSGTVHDYNENKKRKIQNEITIIKSIFEDLSNEIVYEIFDYLDIYHVYEAFFDLSKRFKKLLNNSNLPIKVNISTMSRSKFKSYHQNIIVPNRHRINILRLSNPFSTNIVFSPPKIISKFLQLEILVLDNIDVTYLKNILNHSIHLPKLHSLSIHLAIFIDNSTDIFLQIFRLPKLKYCKLDFQIMGYLNKSSRSTNILSPIEQLAIKPSFPFESFKNLLSYLPRLRRLSIDSIHDRYYKEIRFSPHGLKSFKYVSLNLFAMNFNRLEQIIKNYFRYIEVFHITSRDDPSYLHAEKWEQILSSYMKNIRVFNIHHTGLAENYHHLINEFNTSFWINKQWFFEHQHTWDEGSRSGIFYSINPYRRKKYTLYWTNNEESCSNIQEKNFNSVKHIHIYGKQLTNNSIHYFPNVNELTLQMYLKTLNESIWNNLNRIIPLKQLTKLVINVEDFPFQQLIELLRSTPNLHTIESEGTFFNEVDLKSIQQTNSFQYVSTTNHVKELDIYQEKYTLETFQILLNLFPQLEYLYIGISKDEVKQFIHFLSSKTTDKTHPLSILRIFQSCKKSIAELNRLMRSEDLQGNYLIKAINYGSYLWW